MKKKIISQLLALTMLIASFSFSALATDEDYFTKVESSELIYVFDDFENQKLGKWVAETESTALVTIDDNNSVIKLTGTDGATISRDIAIGSKEIEKWDGTSASSSWVGSGTETDPYLIRNGEDLKLLANTSDTFEGKYFKMTADIDLNNKNWSPIAGSSGFAGHFNGNGYAIKNLYVSSSGTALGLFAKLISGAEISNLGIEDANITYTGTDTSAYLGVLASQITSATISSCYVRNSEINFGKSNIHSTGAIAATIGGSSVCKNVYVNNIEIKASQSRAVTTCAGGFAGKVTNDSVSITNCYAAGVSFSKISYNKATFARRQSDATTATNTYVTSALTDKDFKSGVVYNSNVSEWNLGSAFTSDSENVNDGFPVIKNPERNDGALMSFSVNIKSDEQATIKLTLGDAEEFVIAADSYTAGKWFEFKVNYMEGSSSYETFINGTSLGSDSFDSPLTDASVLKIEAESALYIDNFKLFKSYAEEAEQVANGFDISYTGCDGSTGVLEALELVQLYENYPIEWTSANESIITSAGQITQRGFEQQATLYGRVYLTKELDVYQNASVVKNFVITVSASGSVYGDDAAREVLDYILSILTDEDYSKITKDLYIPSSSEVGGAQITVVSSEPSYIAEDGTVTRPEVDAPSVPVEYTITVEYNDGIAEETLNFVVTPPYSTRQLMLFAAEAVTYETITNEDRLAVTKKLNLPTVGLNGTTITWELYDGDSDVINIETGSITRKNEDKQIVLRATFELEGESLTKDYTFVVLMSDDAKVWKDLNAIELASEVTDNFTLVQTGSYYGSAITWSSNNAAIEIVENIQTIVTRPENSNGDVSVTLTATALLNDVEHERNITVVVKAWPPAEEMLGEVLRTITETDLTTENINEIKNNLNLSLNLPEGMTYEWIVPENSPIAADGKVTRPAVGSDDATVTITLKVTKSDVSVTKDFTFTVLAYEDIASILAKAKQELVFSVISNGQKIDAVTENLSLVSSWNYGTTVTWESSNSDVIEISGDTAIVKALEFGESTGTVILTATISYEGESIQKKFEINPREVTGNVKLIDETFTDVEEGTFKKGVSGKWTVAAQDVFATTIVKDPENIDNNVLQFSKTADSKYDSSTFMVVSPTTKGSNQYILETDIYVTDISNLSMAIMIYANTGTEITVAIPSNLKPQFQYANADGSHAYSTKTLSRNTWYKFRIEFDIQNMTWKVFIDDEAVSGTLYFRYKNEKAGARSFSGIRYGYVWNKANGYHNVYLDNIALSSDVNNSDLLAAAMEAFEYAFIGNQNISAITDDLVLPNLSSYSVTATYESSDTSIISNEGKIVSRPSVDTQVSFTVKMKTQWSQEISRTFVVVVKEDSYVSPDNPGDTEVPSEGMTDEESVMADLLYAVESLEESANLNAVSGNLSLVKTGENSSTISWSSNKPSVASDKGVVTRQKENTTVEYTIFVTKGNASTSQTVTITVLAAPKGGNSSGGGGSSSGGSSDSLPSIKGNPAIETEKDEDIQDNTEKSSFKDVNKDFWGYEAIEYLKENNIINGKGDNNFCPDDTVTREEFLKIAMSAAGISINEETSGVFSDASKDAWFTPFVETAYEKGIINGIDDTSFGVGRAITRQDMCVILCRIWELSGGENSFADNNDIAEYAANAVAAMSEAGIVNGYPDGSFKPGAVATRAEAAQMIYRLINK